MTARRSKTVDWDQFVALLVERLAAFKPLAQYEWFVKVARSSQLRKAFEGLSGTAPVDEVIVQVIDIIMCLRNIAALAEYRNSPDTLVDPIHELRAKRQRAFDHLCKAYSLSRRYRRDFNSLIVLINADKFPMNVEHQLASGFDPTNLKRRGKASDRARAFNGWMIRELDRHVPSAGPKRATAIAELLALADVQVDPQTVTTILKR